MRRRHDMYGVLWVLLLWIVCVATAMGLPPDPNRPAKAGAGPAPSVTPQVERPMVIWFHSVTGNPLESLQAALSSKIVSHVIVYDMHRADAPWQKDIKAKQAIQCVKQAGVRLIWGRNLWPYYANQSMRGGDLYDCNYYIKEIQALRQEGKEIGADGVCLDIEPYGQSVMKGWIKQDKTWTSQDLHRLSAAVSKAVTQAGKVDFLLPAGSLAGGHPYNVLSQLGENRISENTYYANSTPRRIRYPYEIFGAHVHTLREDPKTRGLKYYRVADLFDQSELWSQKKGVLLYTDKRTALAVAQDLNAFVGRLKAQPRVAGLPHGPTK